MSKQRWKDTLPVVDAQPSLRAAARHLTDALAWSISRDHTIKITVESELVTGEFSCSAPVGADCRLGCGEQCAAWLNGDPCGHDRTHDEGFCLPITWLQEEDVAWYELYDGTLTEARSGPIVTRWDGDYYVWTHPECVHPAVAILSDLIKELRAQHYADQCECGCEQWYECEPCSHISLCPTQEAAVRAEARLREMQGE